MAEPTENYVQFIHQSQIYATNNKYTEYVYAIMATR